jgi:hypothetical protein
MWIIHTKYHVKAFGKDTKQQERKPKTKASLKGQGRLNYPI